MKLQKVMGVLLISLLSLVLPIFSSYTYAGVDHHSTDKFIIQWGHDGGLTFSVHATVSSSLMYNIRQVGQNYYFDYNSSDASISVIPSSAHGITSCGSTLAIRKTTSFGNETINLPTPGAYIVNPGTIIIGYKSNGWSRSEISPFTKNVENYGFISPAPSLCYGGGSISDSFTIEKRYIVEGGITE